MSTHTTVRRWPSLRCRTFTQRCKYKCTRTYDSTPSVNAPTTCLFLMLFSCVICAVSAFSASFSSFPPSGSMSRYVVRTNFGDDDLVSPRALAQKQPQPANCPSMCTCIWKSGKETATCDHRQMSSVPIGLSATTQVIDLTGNALNLLPANVFLDRGLVNLQRIFLADCHLEISAESFVKLSNLVELDLCNNSLTMVPSKSFAESAGLRRLSLAGNRIREIKSGAFLALGRLNHLDLSSNQIVHLETDAFRGLRSLQTLKLNTNQLQSLPAAESFVQFLPAKMASMELHENPWHCDCHLKPIREWLVGNNVPMAIKPLCSAPSRLQGYTWDQISSHDFSCPPQIHSVTTHFYKHIGNNVTISCPVTGFPQPTIFWLFETNLLESEMLKTELRDFNRTEPPQRKLNIEKTPSEMKGRKRRLTDNNEEGFELRVQSEQILPSPRYSIQEEMEGHVLTSTLAVHSLKPYDTQRIVCYARNAGGYVMKNFTLIVSTQEPFSSSRSMDFIVTEMFVIFLAISLLLVLLLIFVTVFLARFKKRSFSHHHVHSSEQDSLGALGSDGNGSDRNRQVETILLNGGGAAFDGKPVLSYCDLSEVASKCLLGSSNHTTTTTTTAADSAISMLTSMPATNLLMIDMSGHRVVNCSDQNSTDLSSQSTTATSMTANGAMACNGSSNSSNGANNTNSSNGVSPNNSIESSGSYFTGYNGDSIAMISNGHPGASQQSQYLPYAPPPTLNDAFSALASSAYQRSHSMRALGMPPDILASASDYSHVDHGGGELFDPNARVNVCDYAANQFEYPLLNFKTNPATGDLIYGSRIAPTRLPAMSNSLSFNDNLSQAAYVETSDQPLPPPFLNKISKVTFADQLMSPEQRQLQTRTALAYGTLQRPLNANVRRHAPASLLESSVDSGEKIHEAKAANTKQLSSVTLDETEEDDYYKNLQNGNMINNAPS